MKKTLINVSIVVVASNYNPTIVSKDWIRQKEIISEEPINFAHLPVFSLFESENFILTVDEKRLTVELKNINEANIDNLPSIVENYITSLPETPYTAIGFNYSWILQAETNENLVALLKTMFLQKKMEEKLIKILDYKDFEIGSTTYSNYNDFILKMSLEPHLRPKGIKISFNYHADVTDIEKLKNVILNYNKTYSHSKDVAEKILEE